MISSVCVFSDLYPSSTTWQTCYSHV